MQKRMWLPILLLLLLLLPFSASAVVVDGQNYNHSIDLYTVSAGIGSYQGVNAYNDQGHTANLLRQIVAIPNSGYWYNAVAGESKSRQYGLGYATNFSGNSSRVWMTQQQCDREIHLVGFKGNYQSPYRGFTGTRDFQTTGKGDGSDSKLAKIAFFVSLPKNSVTGRVSGLDAGDAAGAKLTITGAGLPNAGSIGTGERYTQNGATSVSETAARFGNYYISCYIPNASRYAISYTVSYKRGDRLQDANNTVSTQTYTGSGSFSTPSYYLEAGGKLSVTVTAKKTGTIVVDMYKGTGVTESYAGKAFGLYTSTGGYVRQAVTDGSGYAYFYDLPYGGYTVRPMSTPANHFYSPASAGVTLNAESVTAKFTLYRSTGTLRIEYATEDGLSQGNVKFQVTSPSGGVSTGYTDSGGVLLLSDVATGVYRVEQASVPKDYAGVEGVKTAAVSAASTTTIRFYNPIVYDFAVSLIAPPTMEQGTSGAATARITNLSGKSASNVPLKFWDGERLAYYGTISAPAGRITEKTFSVETSQAGWKTLRASANDTAAYYETNWSNNTATHQLEVIEPLNLQIEFIPPNAAYREGMDVLSSFRVKNEGSRPMTPDSRLSVTFCVENGKVALLEQTREQVVIPANGDNLVFFKWRVPAGTAGTTLTLRAAVNTEGTVSESMAGDNTVAVARTIEAVERTDTPDTRYERDVPAGFQYREPPDIVSVTLLSWAVWEWENGWFVKKVYGLELQPSAPVLVPDENAVSRLYREGQWQMRSGYGFTLSYTPAVQTASGYTAPNTAMVTVPQAAAAMYPEFQYAAKLGQYTSLKGTDGRFVLPGGLHFTPIWIPNRDYVVQVMASECWTPAGMLTGYARSNPIRITGSVYDDWVIGRK